MSAALAHAYVRDYLPKLRGGVPCLGVRMPTSSAQWPSRDSKASFIYLANAVNDLRGNWMIVALVLAPLVLISALCLLPDALNLQ